MAPAIDKSVIPGTVTLVDVQHVLNTRHAKGDSDIVLIPTPSHDPDDPLNWSPRRKLLSTICVSTIFIPIGWLGFALLAAICHAIRQAIDIFAVASRSSDIRTHTDLSRPYAPTNGQWIARNILSGFFVAPIEALPEVSVTDVYFTHERGTYMGLYAFFLAGSNYFAPVICGFIAEYQGWQWVFYWPSIFIAFEIIFLFFFMEETNYSRDRVQDIPIANVPLESSHDTGIEETKTVIPVSKQPSPDTELGTVYTKKSYVKKLSLVGPKQQQNTMLRRLWQSLYYLSWPVIFYAGYTPPSHLPLSFAKSEQFLLRVLPRTIQYSKWNRFDHFKFTTIQLWIFYGRFELSCMLLRRDSRQIYFSCRAPFCYGGVGAAYDIHWFGLIVAMCMLAFTNTSGITLSVNYMVDSYRELSGVAMVSIILVRNTMSFAIGYGITPWIENMGYQNCFISAAFIGLACALTFLVMIKFGKSIRVNSREKYWQIVGENWEKGMGH
ncbi:hypothetical protein N7450_005511 [Penicillium hetheringtonii]|uniref:Major facilitator superfamily (MFS) profile domain-containing protein n=1 Tax=Penicillium hetheringtonii TaxID=911720 RepID=A0AAD6DJZ1_9EURO|nr:hypothetical protein N7450_005511 [Penicillium hetheringtonii]